MALHDTPSSRQSVATLREAPTPHRASHASSPEPVEIIAPAPLPIELPAAAIQHQPSHPVAPADVTRIFVAAAEAVADAILVSSGFANGEGRIIVRLQPEVLNGSEVQIVAKDGKLTVVVNPATQDVQNIVEANRSQFEQHLAEKVHAWRVSVAVKRGDKSDERV
jgi:flagellar hook-length control protein FliK